METVAATADLTTATVAALRGNQDQVALLLARVLATVDTSEYRGFAARTRHAAGLDALAQGRYVTAYTQLSRLFAPDGTPLHHHFSYLAVADVAAAAARAERHLEGRTLVDRALAQVVPAAGARLEQLAARARGLLAEPADAGTHFAAPLANAAGEAWPFSGPSFSSTTGSGCDGSGGSTRPSPARGRPRNIPPPRRGAVDPARRIRITRLRGGRTDPVGCRWRARRADRAAARDRYPRRARPDERGDRRPSVPFSSYRRLPSAPFLPQTRHRQRHHSATSSTTPARPASS